MPDEFAAAKQQFGKSMLKLLKLDPNKWKIEWTDDD